MNDYVSLALAAIKDKVRAEVSENFRRSYTCLLETEAQTRRLTVQSQIMEMAKLRIELEKFEKVYSPIKIQCGSIESVDNYLADVKKLIRQISESKNKPLLKRS